MPKPKHGRRSKQSAKRARSEDEPDVAEEQENDSKKPKIEKEQQDEKREVPESAPAAPTTTNVPATADAESKWENLVYYYLARLKGLCDWRTESEPADKVDGKAAVAFNKFHADNLEERVLKNVVKESYPQPDKYWAKNKKLHNRAARNEVDTYMCAGYQEGKEQGVKIITRALKYGILSGILKQDGENYHVNPKYLKNAPSSESSSNSEASVITETSAESEASVDKQSGKGRAGKGSKSDKYQSVPEHSALQVQRSYDELPKQFKNMAGHSRDFNTTWPGHELDSNLRNEPSSSHRDMPVFNHPKVPRLPKTRAEHRKDLHRNKPGTSKDNAFVKHTHGERKFSSNNKRKVQKIVSKKLRLPTRNSARPRNISAKGYTSYKSKGSHDDYHSRSHSVGQRKKRCRSRSKSSDSN